MQAPAQLRTQFEGPLTLTTFISLGRPLNEIDSSPPGFPDESTHESPRPADARDARPGGRPVGHCVGEERDAALAPAAHAARAAHPACGHGGGHEAAPAAALRRHASAHEPLTVRELIIIHYCMIGNAVCEV